MRTHLCEGKSKKTKTKTKTTKRERAEEKEEVGGKIGMTRLDDLHELAKQSYH